jgi:hypothetical protein
VNVFGETGRITRPVTGLCGFPADIVTKKQKIHKKQGGKIELYTEKAGDFCGR